VPDRLNRDLGMHTFAHEVGCDQQPSVCGLKLALFASVEGIGLFLLVVR
jgi:hypothetical protein